MTRTVRNSSVSDPKWIGIAGDWVAHMLDWCGRSMADQYCNSDQYSQQNSYYRTLWSLLLTSVRIFDLYIHPYQNPVTFIQGKCGTVLDFTDYGPAPKADVKFFQQVRESEPIKILK